MSQHEERARLARLCRRAPEWRKFAELRAELKTPVEAYQGAGYMPHRGNAARLARRPEVLAYVDELMEEAAEYAAVRRTAVVVRIDRVGRANVADFYEDDGVTLKNVKSLPRELTEALAAITFEIVGEDKNGVPIRRPAIKVHDKNQANFALLKMLGGLPEPDPPVRNLNIFNALSVEDQIALAALLEAIGSEPTLIGGETAGERGAA